VKITFEGTLEEFRLTFNTGHVVLCTAGEREGGAPRPRYAEKAEVLEGQQPWTPQDEEAFTHFCRFVNGWRDGFEVEGAPQPDRLALLRDLGASKWAVPILRLAYEMGGLQLLIQRTGNFDGEADAEYVDRLAANMAQVSHMAFPELAGMYAYSSKWRETWNRNKSTSAA